MAPRVDFNRASQPVGYRANGSPIFPMAGGDDAALEARIGELTAELRRLGETRTEASPAAAKADGARYAAALDGSKASADEMAELYALRAEKAEAARKAELRTLADEMVKEALSKARIPSDARQAIVGGGAPTSFGGGTNRMRTPAHPSLKAAFGEDYEGGQVLSNIMGFKGMLSDGIDIDSITRSKAWLEEHGMIWVGVPANTGKATLGETSAAGGYVLPNNLVEGVQKPMVQRAIYRDMVTQVPGVMVRAVDQPYRLGAPTRMTSADWGATKDNRDESYGSYSAPLVTFAAIYDIGKQYLRFSAGSAERDVLDELTKAQELAENYEVIAGPGTGTTGSGDACLGVYVSLNATPTWLGVKGAKTGSASNSTVAGSFASACAELMGILAGRNREVSAIVVDHTSFFTALAQGSDNAGFWVDPAGGPTGFTRTASGQLQYFGTPVVYDTNLGSNAATKIAIAADWKAFKLYRGMEFRIDSSDQAGDRWDKNLVGFRGEMEMGFNAETQVHVGAAQLMTAIIP